MMVTNILGEQSFQMAFIQRNHVVQQVSPTASHPPLRDAILPWSSKGSSLGNDPCRFDRCDHLKPKLLIAIKDQVFVNGFKGKRLAQLLDDPSAGRMLRDVNVQDVPPVMTDDEEAVEHAERDRWHSKEIHGRNRFPVVRRKACHRLAGSGSLGARFIQREMVLSQSSKPSMQSSPWIRGAPQVGFSTTIRKINSRTSFGVGLLPTWLRTLEISRQYTQKPARCQRTMVSGVTMMRECFQADQTRRAITQKSLSKRSRLGRGCRRFSTTSC